MASNSSKFPHNNYATKKTITQGMLDLAVLTVNVMQLKRILEVGEEYPYYVVMMTLVCLSIALQVPRACLYVVLGMQDTVEDDSLQRRATVLNNVVLVLGVITGAINTVISALDMSEPKVTHV